MAFSLHQTFKSSSMITYTKQETLIRVQDVNLSYDDKQILRDINFSIKNVVRPGIQQGQAVSLIGRSGIGKTQLFKLLAGLQEPTSGHIYLKDNRPVKAGDMGVIFQNYYLFEWRTVCQSLLLAAKKNWLPSPVGYSRSLMGLRSGW